MLKFMRLILTGLILTFFLSSTNAFAGKDFDRVGSVADNNTDLVVIKGKIRSIDLYKMEIILEECPLLGNKPLKLSGSTTYYIGAEEDSVDTIRGGAQFSEDDKINYYDLDIGHTIKCNYEIIDGNFWALRVVRVSTHVQHILFIPIANWFSKYQYRNVPY